MGNLKDLNFDIHYAGTNRILNDFLRPALKVAKSYDRLTSFFNLTGFLALSQGIENIWRSGGKIRVVIGLHDVPSEIIAAYKLSKTDALEGYLNGIQNRLLEEISTLSDEIEKDRISTVAWMLSESLLEIKIACPIPIVFNHIFHSKNIVIKDEHGNIVSATGSPNETRPGLQGNYEDLTIHTSWGADPRYSAQHAQHFERIWSNEIDDLNIINLQSDFAQKIIDTIPTPGLKSIQKEFEIKSNFDFVSTLKNNPRYAHLSYPSAILYPHQERALRDGLNRNVMRVLLADEVGLGKTLEAGALINHGIKFRGFKKVCILVPASLLWQFQEELHFYFGLDFYVWDSKSKVYLDIERNSFKGIRFSSPVDKGTPDFQIISSQLARGSGKSGSIFDDLAIFPDLLVVDEAHAARLHPDGTSVKPTRLFRALEKIKGKIPNILLLTATPLQVHPLEFHGLLSILGLGASWSKRTNYLRSLEILSGNVDKPNLQDADLITKLCLESAANGGDFHHLLTSDDKEILEKLQVESRKSSTLGAIFVQRNWLKFIRILAFLHPAQALVIRNTRRALEELGYEFPERVFSAPELNVSPQLKLFFTKLDLYLDTTYGDVEAAADPSFGSNRGFAKSGYQQRLASSLYSAKKSLAKRLAKIETIEEGLNFNLRDFDDAYEDDENEIDVEINFQLLDEKTRMAIKAAALIERVTLQELIGFLENIPEGIFEGDPKYLEASNFITSRIRQDQILVFSRYTDTLEGFIEYLGLFHSDVLDFGFGLYTGKEVWKFVDGSKIRSNKSDIKKSLQNGEIRLVICSDAASEGLNLQSARILINLDVPWNPSRLEQRIGRIARLGQKAKKVDVVNLWYPESVEAKMYKRLLDRKDLYELAVGEFPDIFGKAIREHSRIRSQIVQSDFDVESIAELEKARQQSQSLALKKVWDVKKDLQSESNRLLSELENFVLNRFPKSIKDEANPITFGNLEENKMPIPNFGNGDSRLLVISHNEVPLYFAIESGEKYFLVKDSALVKIFKSFYIDVHFLSEDCHESANNIPELLRLVTKSLANDFPGSLETSVFFPEHSEINGNERPISDFAVAYVSNVNFK